MAANIYDWSLTAANNSNADGDLTWAEGQAPSTVNNSARVVMQRVKQLLVDIGGSIAAAGTANGLTVAANSPFTALADGQIISFRATASNSGAATLNVNSIGAKAIRKMDSTGDVALIGGEIKNTGIYVAQYSAALNGAAGAWLLINPTDAPGGVGSFSTLTFTGLLTSPFALKADGRLTLETGVPVSTTDQLAKGTIYYSPYVGNVISLYSGTAWVNRTFTELSLALTATSGKPYDVFVYDNAGVAALETLVWTDDTNRATALVRQDGVLCKTGALTRRYVGTFYASAANQCEDSKAKRYVWNMYNRMARVMQNADETTATWSYSITTIRQANANTANQVDFVRGLDEHVVDCSLSAAGANSTLSAIAYSGIGLDSTTIIAGDCIPGILRTANPNSYAQMITRFVGHTNVGKHSLMWLERGDGTATMTWRGVSGLDRNGLRGIVIA